MDKKKVVIIGGGTGTHTVLRGLKRYQKQIDLTAVVTMADSGGSTGRLRDEFGYLPVGDVRMALAALASDVDEHEELLRKLFMYRFDKGKGLTGHNFGNLLLVALIDILGSEEETIKVASRVLRIQGKVVPVTTEKVDLVATYDDGIEIKGEHYIDEPSSNRFGHLIRKIETFPKATISASAKEAIMESDLIILGPGDLYTSVLANCVVGGVPEAIANSSAKIVYVCNLMTRDGQTTGMNVLGHTREITSYIKQKPDFVLVNSSNLPVELVKKYEEDNEYPVGIDCDKNDQRYIISDLLATEAVKTVKGDVVKRSLIRHDSGKLAKEIITILSK